MSTVIDDVDVNRQIDIAPRVADHVVDADAHVTPPPGMWADYLAPQFRALAPVVETDGEFDYVVFEGNRRKLNLMASQAGRAFNQYKNNGRMSDMRVGGWMAPARLDDMDRDGIDVAVVFGGGPLATGNLELYNESFAAYNRWIMDFCSHDPKRLHPVAYLPMADVDQAIAMMREARSNGAVAVNIPAFPQTVARFNKAESQFQALSGDSGGDRQYRDPEFDPLWAAACELDLAITELRGKAGVPEKVGKPTGKGGRSMKSGGKGRPQHKKGGGKRSHTGGASTRNAKSKHRGRSKRR